MLKLGLTKVVHGEIVTDTKRIETDISNVSLEVLRSGKERKRRGFLRSSKAGRSTIYSITKIHCQP